MMDGKGASAKSKGAKVGDRFGKLVINELIPSGNGGFKAVCQCDCGGHIARRLSEIGRDIFCCGCVRPRHGHSVGGRTKEHKVWTGMRQRCENPNNKRYSSYGGRGIKVCDRWAIFSNFLADMGPVPEGMTIDREDNDGDYSPDNCRWATDTEQSRNRRNVRTHTVGGVTLYAPEWAVRLGINYRTLANLLTKMSMQEIYDRHETGLLRKSARKKGPSR